MTSEHAPDRTGDHAFTDVVDGQAEAPETPMHSLPLRARLIFVSVFSVIALLLYGVGVWGLVPPQAEWPTALAWTVRGAGLLAAILLVTLLIRANTARGTDGQAKTAHVLLGVGWILFTATLVTDLVLRLPMFLLDIPNPMRSRAVAVALFVLVVAVALWGHDEARRTPRVRKVEVSIRGLDAALAGTSIAVLTDTHFDAWTSRKWADAVVARVNAIGADIVVHAGDLADGSVAQRGHQVAALAEVRSSGRFDPAREAKFYIAGNHEYYSGVDDWLGQMAGHGWQVLLNDHAVVTGVNGAPGQLVMAGVDDPTGTGQGRGPDLDAALDGVPGDLPLILLAHQPHLLKHSVDRVDLQISGHTHGGQIWPFHYLVRLREPVVQGLSRHGDRTQVYTSRGTGFWGPPFRVFAPSEISLIVLNPAD